MYIYADDAKQNDACISCVYESNSMVYICVYMGACVHLNKHKIV